MDITQAQHEFLISMGFTEPRKVANDVTYWHEGTSIYLQCISSLTQGHFNLKNTGFDIVLALPNETSDAHMVVAAALPVDTVKFKDLAHFMMYRAFSSECAEHRLRKTSFERTRDTCHEAEQAADGAHNFYKLAAASLRQEMDVMISLPKPPAFRLVACE